VRVIRLRRRLPSCGGEADAGGLRTGSQETAVARVRLGLFVAFGSNPSAQGNDHPGFTRLQLTANPGFQTPRSRMVAAEVGTLDRRLLYYKYSCIGRLMDLSSTIALVVLRYGLSETIFGFHMSPG
jgi:hypothetical protein